MNPATVAAITCLSFAVLVVACIGCAICAGWLLCMSRLGRDIGKDSKDDFRLPLGKEERK